MTRTALPKMPNRLDAIEGSRPFDEQVLAMIIGLASEVTVLRQRLDACERLLVAGGTLESGAVDAFDPEPEAQSEREAQRLAIMEKVFRPLREAAQAELAAVESSTNP